MILVLKSEWVLFEGQSSATFLTHSNAIVNVSFFSFSSYFVFFRFSSLSRLGVKTPPLPSSLRSLSQTEKVSVTRAHILCYFCLKLYQQRAQSLFSNLRWSILVTVVVMFQYNSGEKVFSGSLLSERYYQLYFRKFQE